MFVEFISFNETESSVKAGSHKKGTLRGSKMARSIRFQIFRSRDKFQYFEIIEKLIMYY